MYSPAVSDLERNFIRKASLANRLKKMDTHQAQTNYVQKVTQYQTIDVNKESQNIDQRIYGE